MAEEEKELRELYIIGTESFESGNYIKAHALLSEVNRMNPNFADVNNKLGVIASLKGDMDVAIAHFRRAIELNPNYTEAGMNLTISLNEMGRTEEAGSIFDKCIKNQDRMFGKIDRFEAGKIANEHYRLGNIYLDFGMPAEAVDEYRKALRIRPDMVDIQTRLGIALRDMGDKDGAITEFEKAKKMNPRYGAARVQLALSYFLKGRKADAIKELEDTLKENPGLKMAENYLKFVRSREA